MAMGGKMNSLRDILAARVGDGRSKQVGRRMQGQSAPMPKPPKPAGAMMGSAPAPMPQAPAPMPQMAPRNVSFAGEPMQAQLPRERMQPASAPPKSLWKCCLLLIKVET